MKAVHQPRWPLALALLLPVGGIALVATQIGGCDASRPSAQSTVLSSNPPKRASSQALEASSARRPSSAVPGVASSLIPNTTSVFPTSTEGRLLAVISLIEQQNLDAALMAAAKLTAEVPTFQTAQLVYADLLRFRSGKMAQSVMNGGALVTHSPDVKSDAKTLQAWQAQLDGLRKELTRRVQAAGALPPADSIPGEFLSLKPSLRHAIAVDASKSRLYLFTHEDGKLRLTADFYVSIGKLGMDKRKEGDQRTPQGMYFVGRRIPGAKLPDLYGKGALTLNYPNDWDRALGREGSGIWLHGAPSDQFARLPEASDGCIVLANPDLLQLMSTVDDRTPVLVRDRLDWVADGDMRQRQAMEAFGPTLEAWKEGWANADTQAQARLYSAELTAAPKASQRHLANLFRSGSAVVQDTSVFAWRDHQGEIRIVNLAVKSSAHAKPLSLRQYWRKSGERWQLFSEDILR